MRLTETLSIKARLRISIIVLVVTIILTLSVLHLDGVVGESLEDTAERAHLLGDQIKSYVIETTNRSIPPAGVSLATRKQVWYDAIKQDPILPRLMQQSLTHSSSVVEVAILDSDNRVLASSTSGRIGKEQPLDRSVADWEKRSNWKRLRDLFRSTEDYAVSLPLGFAGAPEPVIIVQVLVSPVLMRAELMPKINDLAILSGGALLLSIVLAALVSQMVSRSIGQIVERIESISRGEDPLKLSPDEVPELINVQSKLNRLGEKFSGARSDMMNLRSSVDQLLASLEEAVMVFGPDARLRMAGNPAERLLGRSRTELIGQPLDRIFPNWTGLGRQVQEAFARHTTLRSVPAILERPNLPDGNLLVSVEWLDYEEGKTGMLVTLRDAESRQQVASQLDVARRLSSISRVMSGVGHEIKNPLNAIMLHLEIAQTKLAAAAPDSVADLDVIRRELFRLDRVIKTFLDFNRPLDVNFSELDLVGLARETSEILSSQANKRHIKIVVDTDQRSAVIHADAALLKEALLNVVTNGLEAMDSPGDVTVGVQKTAEDYVLTVRDQGGGIPPEIQDKIFNLYFTTKPLATGVGLSIAYRVVQMHGATINFETEAGRGTCFRLGFPHSGPTEAAAA